MSGQNRHGNQMQIENWRDQKFGMFIHWGLYSLHGEGEWAMFLQQIDKDRYRTLEERFTAEKFDADSWAQLAKDAGMRYMVITAKHHDGFSLWESPGSYESFDSMHSAAKRDFIREYTDACRKAGLLVGIYYSPMDWRFPGFFLPELFRENANALVKQNYDQIKELVSNYGQVDILWYDGGEDFCVAMGLDINQGKKPDDIKINPRYKDFYKAGEVDRMVRTLQPGIITNNRFGMRQYGDYTCPEMRVGAFNVDDPWETCDSISEGCWGYRPGSKVRSLRSCIQLLVKVVTGGGNLLLNVGPKPDGTIEQEQIDRLREVGAWLKQYGGSIYGTRGGPIKCPEGYGTTHKENKLYVHVWDWEKDYVALPDTDNPAVKCLTAKNACVKQQNGTLMLSVSAEDRLAMDTIFELTYSKKVSDVFPQVVDWTLQRNINYSNPVNLGDL